MKKILLITTLAMTSNMATASVECQAEYIKGLKVSDSGEVIYTNSSGISRLAGTPGTPIGSKYMLQTLLEAIENKYQINSSFPKGYNCNTSNTEVSAEWIKIERPD